jgi:hypothetical protein
MGAARGRLLDEIFAQSRRARELYTLEVAVGNNLSAGFQALFIRYCSW